MRKFLFGWNGILTGFILSISTLSFAQYQNLAVQPRFDAVYTQLYGPIYNIASTSNDINDQGQLTWNKANLYQQGWVQVGSTQIWTYTQACKDSQSALGSTRSGSLEALLRMYEATCDMKYIWEFMEQATHVINCRADKVTPQQSGSPYLFIHQVPWHGRILQALSHFVYLVNSKNLGSTIIPLAHRPNFNNKTTIGEYSSAMNTQNKEMMNFLLGRLWRGSDECICKPTTISDVCGNGSFDTGTTKNISELNFQAPYGCALIYMYLSNPTEISTYAVKAVEMARAYLVTRNGILNYNSTYNSYYWCHDGWQLSRPNTSSSWVAENDHYEDIGHAAFDIDFPLLYNKFYNSFYPAITGGQYFENYQMVRFRNQFTNVIYNSATASTCNSIQQTFDCNVVGSCIYHYGPTTYTSYQMNAKNWTNFYLYDNVTGAQGTYSVYPIIMDYFIAVESCLPINEANYGGAGITGLADIVVANYDKENRGPCNQIGVEPKSAVAEPDFAWVNPVSSHFTIPASLEAKNVQVFDMKGAPQNITIEGENYLTGNLPDGNYIVVMEINGATLRKRLVVLKGN